MNIRALVRRLIPLAVVILLAISTPYQSPSTVEAQTPVVEIDWRAYSNPTAYWDEAYAVCEAGDYIYVVGGQSCGDWTCGRIEVRHKVNGSLVNAFDIESINKYLIKPFTDCAIGGGKLYAVSGYAVRGYRSTSIYVFDLEFIFDPTLFKLNARFTVGKGYYYSILFLDNHTYVAGESGSALIVEKRRADNLELVKERITNPPPNTNYVTARFIGVNPVTKQLWVVGYADTNLWIEILDLDLNLVKVVNKSGVGGRIAVFDEEGNAYVIGFTKTTGAGFVAEFDKESRELLYREVPLDVLKAAYVNGYIAIATHESGGHVLYVLDKGLRVVSRVVLSEKTRASGAGFSFGKMAFDGESLYVAGWDEAPGDREWAIYSISIKAPTATTVTVTTPPTTAASTVTTTLVITHTTVTTVAGYTTVALPVATTATVFLPTTVTTTVVTREVSYIPTSTVVRPWLAEETVALGVSVAMLVASVLIGLRLRRR